MSCVVAPEPIAGIEWCQHRYVVWHETATQRELGVRTACHAPLDMSESVDWTLDAADVRDTGLASEVRRTGTAYLLRGYGETLASFKRMAELAKLVNPELTDDDISCSKVSKSSYCKGFSVVVFAVNERSRLQDFYEKDHIDFYFA